MQLNIKGEHAYTLASQITAMTGETLTRAVVESLQLRLEKLQVENAKNTFPTKDLSEQLLAIGRDCASRMKEPWLSMNIDDYLYDEKGLPK